MVYTRRPILIADCFAGKGRFDDNSLGSPLIISELVAEKYREQPDASLKVICIEKKYGQDLRKNCAPYADFVTCLDGDYEERMNYFIHKYSPRKQNLFLYVDPYGIKSVRFSYFSSVSEMGFNSTEILLNFNTFGFLREGCRLLKKPEMTALTSQDDPDYVSDMDSALAMDEIAGGDYWREIIENYYRTRDFNDAEEKLNRAYCEKLKEHFDYILNMPIKTALTNVPKYRIIHGTNHPDGLILMADNMNKRWRAFKEQQQGGQCELGFVWELPDLNLSSDIAIPLDRVVLECCDTRMELKNLLACLFDRFGIRYSTSDITRKLRDMEGDGLLAVERDPPRTFVGKLRTGWDYDSKEYKVYVMRTKRWQQSLL
jgi:three-Cys-motif partner protein